MSNPKTNRIYIFFIVLALLFWNPLTFYLLYHDTPAYPVKIVRLFYWLVFAGGLTLVFFIHRNKVRERFMNVALSLAFVGILFSVLAVVNAFTGVQESKGLIFAPNTKVRHQTVEFDYTTITNDLGLRNKAISTDKGNKFRILCIGDSWTFGWGVNMEDSYPARLEEYLHKNGYPNVEVINGGQPGIYTSGYAEHIEKLVPVLHPDMVLVGVLQLDDLAQLYENNPAFRNKAPKVGIMDAIKTSAGIYFKASVSNILANIAKNNPETIEVRSNWEASVKNMTEEFSYLQQVSFESLDDSVQALFRTGNLNPGLLDYYINFPDRVNIFNNPDHPATKFALAKMEEDLAYIRKTFNNSVFVSMPMNVFTGHKVVRTPADVLNPYFASNNHIDSMYSAAAAKSNMPYIEMTQHFLQLDRDGFFFLYDGHPTPKGYDAIASYIGNQLIARKMVGATPLRNALANH